MVRKIYLEGTCFFLVASIMAYLRILGLLFSSTTKNGFTPVFALFAVTGVVAIVVLSMVYYKKI